MRIVEPQAIIESFLDSQTIYQTIERLPSDAQRDTQTVEA